MRKLLSLGIMLAAVVPFASAQSLTTLYGSNNNGNTGGALYFDVTVGASDLMITGFDTNTNASGSFGFTVYTHAGAGIGNEVAGGWTQVATGTGTGGGLDLPSPVSLNNTFMLSAGTSYGMALVMGSEASHHYTNGNGSNQDYSNADLSLHLGSATNVPFTGSVFSPRVWNGTVYYQSVPEPTSMAALGLGALALIRRRRNKKA